MAQPNFGPFLHRGKAEYPHLPLTHAYRSLVLSNEIESLTKKTITLEYPY